jgi:hypothetical protein
MFKRGLPDNRLAREEKADIFGYRDQKKAVRDAKYSFDLTNKSFSLISPGISGYTTTLARLSGGSQRLTAPATITVRTRAFYRRPVPPFPHLPAPPAHRPAGLLVPGHMPSHPGWARTSAHEAGPLSVIVRLPGTDRKSRADVPACTCAAPSIIVLRAMHVYSLGVHGNVYYRHVLHILPATGFHSKTE